MQEENVQDKPITLEDAESNLEIEQDPDLILSEGEVKDILREEETKTNPDIVNNDIPGLDVPGDGENDPSKALEEKEGPAPIPGYVKYGLPGFALFLIASITTAYFYFTAPSESSSVDGPLAVVNPDANSYSKEPNVIEKDSDFIPASANEPGDNVSSKIVDQPVQATITNEELDNLSDRQDLIESTVKTHSVIIESLEKADINFKRKLNDSSEVSSLKDRIISLERKLLAIQNSVNQNSIFVNNYTEEAESTPPFTLLSVDQWGGQYNAVLMLNGKETIARVGDIRAGWKIDRFLSNTLIEVCKVGKKYCAKIHTAGA